MTQPIGPNVIARGAEHYGAGGAGYTPRVQFDSNVPAGVDPDALWRKQNSQRQRRMGATPAERAGESAGYTPGYGRSAAQNSGGGLTPRPQWDAQFQQRLTPAANADHRDWLWPASSGGATSPENPGLGAPRPQPTPIPNGPTMPGTTAPIGIPSPGPAPIPPSPGNENGPAMQVPGVNGGIQRQIPGVNASATFIPGQNSPANLAKRPRPPVDPYS